MSRVDDFLTCYDRGVFVLEAEAGLGKTAFLAHLVRQRDYIHHFVELAQGLDGVAPGLKSLAAQLVRAWVLNPHAAEGVLPGSAARPEFLQNLLKEAADWRDRTKPGEKIVLVVDALDEAGTPAPGQNVLGLPRILPKGVYLVVSQRPVEVPLEVPEAPREVVRIEAQGRDNLADMGKFLEQAAGWPGVKEALDTSQIQPAQTRRHAAREEPGGLDLPALRARRDRNRPAHAVDAGRSAPGALAVLRQVLEPMAPGP